MTEGAQAAGPTGPDTDPVIVAAGGVVLDATGPERRVLVVHRPAYDDWSLPKGHVDPGEPLVTTAVREVLEETGVLARAVGDAGTTQHLVVRDGTPAHKRVHWFLMHPDPDAPGDPTTRPPDAEVDRAAWWTLDDALRDLTHAGERALLARVTGGA